MSPQTLLEQAQTCLSQGNQLAEQGDIAGSIQSYQQALQLKPDYLPAFPKLCQAYSAASNWEELLQLSQSFIALNPQLPLPHLHLARALKQTDQPEPAIEAYLKALELKSDWWPGIYQEVALFLAKQPNHRQQAAAAFRQAAKLKPDWSTGFYSQFATLLHKLYCFDEEIAIYQHALRLDPKAWSLHAALGDTYYGQGKYTEAVESYESAIQLKPNTPDLRKKLESALQAREQLEGGIDLHQPATKLQSLPLASLPGQNNSSQAASPLKEEASLPISKVMIGNVGSRNPLTKPGIKFQTKFIENPKGIAIAAVCVAIPYIAIVAAIAFNASIQLAMPFIVMPILLGAAVGIMYWVARR